MSTSPKVWCNFTVKSKNGDLKLRLQDMPEDRLEEVVSLHATHFAAGEPFHKIAGISKSKEAREESKEFVAELIKDCKVVICCVDNDPNTVGEIVGISLITLVKKDDPEEDMDIKTRTKEMTMLFNIMGQLFDKYDAMKEFNLDSFYDDRGIVVMPEYRGLGIAEKLLHNRREICTAEGVPMTGAWVTSFGSQKAAQRDGWTDVYEVSYEELSKKHDLIFQDVPPTCKFVIAKAI